MLNQSISTSAPKTQEPVVKIINGRAMTSSIEVAKFFGKEHKNVLRRINKIKQKDPDFCRLNFELTEYLVDSPLQGTISRHYYLMSRAGFSLVVLGFTGDSVFDFQIAYVKRFEEMDAALKGLKTKGQLPLFTPSPLEIALTNSQRKSLDLLVSTWSACSRIGKPRAWQRVHNHFGTKSIADFRLLQLSEIIQWIQERINIAIATGGLDWLDPAIFDPRRLLAYPTERKAVA